ncbi:hypothetical protein RDABS01_010821 [Bienertia sinuspersici]
MAIGLEEKWKALSLMEEEEDALICDDEPDELSEQLVAHCLVGKLLTNSPFNPEALKNTIKNLWKPSKGLVVTEIENNIFVLQFFSKNDREKVMDQGSWSFDGKLLLLKEFMKGEQPAEMSFNMARFWVKVYQLPVDRRKKPMAMAIANRMGMFVEFDSSDPFGYRRFMRYRVDLDISKQLMKGMKIQVGKVQKWVDFKYEKLPEICYPCGLFGHSAKDYGLYDEEIPESMYPYGTWLWASPTWNKFLGESLRDSEIQMLEDFKSSLLNSKAKQKLNNNMVYGGENGETECGRGNKRGRNDSLGASDLKYLEGKKEILKVGEG